MLLQSLTVPLITIFSKYTCCSQCNSSWDHDLRYVLNKAVGNAINQVHQNEKKQVLSVHEWLPSKVCILDLDFFDQDSSVLLYESKGKSSILRNSFESYK